MDRPLMTFLTMINMKLRPPPVVPVQNWLNILLILTYAESEVSVADLKVYINKSKELESSEVTWYLSFDLNISVFSDCLMLGQVIFSKAWKIVKNHLDSLVRVNFTSSVILNRSVRFSPRVWVPLVKMWNATFKKCIKMKVSMIILF